MKIDVDRIGWLANMGINNANLAAKAGLDPASARGAALLAVRLLQQAAEEIMQAADGATTGVLATAKKEIKAGQLVTEEDVYFPGAGGSHLELRPGELN